MGSSSNVTTVVITRNRRTELMRSLGHHRLPAVVVDNNSSDGTVEAVRRRYPRITVIEAGRNLGAVARNLGAREADTPYVAFADDDSWWAPGATARAAALLDTFDDLAVVVGHVLVGLEQRPDAFNDVLAASPLRPREGVPGVPVLGFMACAVVVRRDAYLDAGGFDPVVAFGGEEARLAIDISAAGGLIQYVPAVVVHHHPSSMRASAAAQRRRGVRNALLTMVMRRPWSRVGGQVVHDLASFPDGLLGVAATVPRLPAALCRRSPVDGSLEAELRLLERVLASSRPERKEAST